MKTSKYCYSCAHNGPDNNPDTCLSCKAKKESLYISKTAASLLEFPISPEDDDRKQVEKIMKKRCSSCPHKTSTGCSFLKSVPVPPSAEKVIKKLEAFVAKKTKELETYAQHGEAMKEEEGNDTKWEKYVVEMETTGEIVNELRKILRIWEK